MTTQVNVTKMFESLEPWDCSNSVANLGPNAGRITWGNSLEIARDYLHWLVSSLEDALADVRDDARQTGAWASDEIANWTQEECLAYLVQTFAADLRLLGSDDNDLETCLETYKTTNWGQEPEYPQAHYYLENGGVHAEWNP